MLLAVWVKYEQTLKRRYAVALLKGVLKLLSK
jgi:hypothetical protein